MKRYVFLDRDGTLIVNRHYLAVADGVELLPGVVEGLKLLQGLGLGLIVVTNQSGIGRGLFDWKAAEAVNSRLRTLLATEGVTLDAILVCPHRPDEACECRKPRAGLVLQAAAEICFAPNECFIIGDQDCDVELGRNLDAVTIRVGPADSGEPEATIAWFKADHVVWTLMEAAEIIAHVLAGPATAGRT